MRRKADWEAITPGLCLLLLSILTTSRGQPPTLPRACSGEIDNLCLPSLVCSLVVRETQVA